MVGRCGHPAFLCYLLHRRIDPILISVVCFDETLTSRHTKLKSFLAKLTSGKKPVEYYARHVKNVAFLGGIYKEGEVDKVLAICTGVENLVVKETFMSPSVNDLPFFDNPRTCTALRRLHINLWWYVDGRSTSTLSFEHSCFANLTHLQLTEDDEMWPFYTGWDHLSRLSHLALACRGSPWELKRVVQALPALRYVALTHFYGSDRDNYITLGRNAAWGVYFVIMAFIPRFDWECGARGMGDFWDTVEDDVERRLRDMAS